MKRFIRKCFLPILSLLTTSCGQNFLADCYQCYMGNMLVSTASLPYDGLNQKEIEPNNLESDQTYYANVYILSDSQEASDFFSASSLSVSNEEKNKNLTIDEDSSLIYFFAQIPAGYSAFKRDNIQASLPGSKNIILLTDNFYYYANRTNMFYCQIDIKKDEEMTEPYVYSFYYELSSESTQNILETNIRVLYQVNQQD